MLLMKLITTKRVTHHSLFTGLKGIYYVPSVPATIDRAEKHTSTPALISLSKQGEMDRKQIGKQIKCHIVIKALDKNKKGKGGRGLKVRWA